MDNLARHALYARQRNVPVAWLDDIPAYLTGPQRRRLRHKRSEHSHQPGQRCLICRPPAKKWDRSLAGAPV